MDWLETEIVVGTLSVGDALGDMDGDEYVDVVVGSVDVERSVVGVSVLVVATSEVVVEDTTVSGAIVSPTFPLPWAVEVELELVSREEVEDGTIVVDWIKVLDSTVSFIAPLTRCRGMRYLGTCRSFTDPLVKCLR